MTSAHTYSGHSCHLHSAFFTGSDTDLPWVRKWDSIDGVVVGSRKDGETSVNMDPRSIQRSIIQVDRTILVPTYAHMAGLLGLEGQG